MSGHTPGPWSVCGDGACSCKSVACADHPIAKVIVGDWGDDFPTLRLVGTSTLEAKAEAYMGQITYGHVAEEVARANARLIAAAPELLEALKELLDFLDRAEPHERESPWKYAAYIDARAIIAKAEGKSE